MTEPITNNLAENIAKMVSGSLTSPFATVEVGWDTSGYHAFFPATTYGTVSVSGSVGTVSVTFSTTGTPAAVSNTARLVSDDHSVIAVSWGSVSKTVDYVITDAFTITLARA